ncbi:hypothetical protein GGF46_003371 [Coemansia sp. RSA 552]|nr:hypothetical protein GGF46_003371 [Coemansia sp. RSA 552]
MVSAEPAKKSSWGSVLPPEAAASTKQRLVAASGDGTDRSQSIALGALQTSRDTRFGSSGPPSPLAAASTTGQYLPANRLSYAHQQSVSGWDKVLSSISLRAADGADEANHAHGPPGQAARVPGLGEHSALAHEDVQYVYESDEDNRRQATQGLLHPLEHGLINDGLGTRDVVGGRGRSDTGFSSTGSRIDHGSIASTTALSPTPAQLDSSTDKQFAPTSGTNAAPPYLARSRQVNTNGYTQQHDDETESTSPSAALNGNSAARVARLFAQAGASGRQHARPRNSGSPQVSNESLADIDIEDDEDEDAEGGSGLRKKGDDLRKKLKRAVIKAAVITRKGPRQMKSAGSQGMFPFLQDAMFVPMFHFMRDEHGHRAPPVIFDAIGLSISMPGELPTVDEDHHFAVRIALQYGDVKWVIYRRLNDFLSLHTVLTLRRFQGRVHQLPAFPQQLGYALEKARALKPGHAAAAPSGRMVQATADRRQALEQYLLKLLRALNMRPAYELCTFLELSAVSIMKDVGWKGKEGLLDRRVEHTTGMWCTPHDLRRWSRQWVLVRDSFIAFCTHISDPYPIDVLFADPQFDIKFRKKKGHNPLFPYRITVSNQYRRIQLRSDSERVINEWRNSIEEMKSTSAWAVPHRFESFAPIREGSRMIWFVDGDDYFYALSEALENATDCIYIGDWWLSPELHLRRPPALNEEYRLDRLLKRKAEEGVKIYVAIYKEVTVSLTINSAYTKRKLQSLHPNIMVQRHPDHLAGGTMFWAHHEKMVVVDNTFAFMGGLDLCWGRYDTHGHRLGDYFLPHRGTPFSHLQIFFGQDYNNARIHDFADVNDYEDTLIDRRTTPRMPWHDIHMAMIGQPARDVARHFIQRWNFIKSSKAMAKTHMPFLMPKGEYSATRNDMQYRGTCRTQMLRSSAEWSMGITKESSIHTAYCEMIRDAKHFVYIENQFFVSNAREDPGYTIKNRIAEALVDRVKRAHRRGEKFQVIIIIPLMPAFEGDVNAVGAATLKLVMHWQYQSICRGDHSILAQLEKQGIRMDDYIRFFGLRNYDVIRRFADGAVKQDVSALAGNAPVEEPGYNQELQKHGAPVIGHTEDATRGIEPSVADIAEADIAEAEGHPETIAMGSINQPSLSFTSPERQSTRGEYEFQRPDEAFAEDTLPMQDNPARHSQELSRRPHERHMRAPPPTTGRRSFNLPKRPVLRQRSSFSGFRGFFSGISESRPHTSRSRAASLSSEASSDTSSSSDSSSNSDDAPDAGAKARRAYRRRVDEEGRRKNAFRYLVRGTEHIKQYGRHRSSKHKGSGLHRRIYKKDGDNSDMVRRDSDSEFGSHMRVDMADVENYVHPSKPGQATFLGDRENGRPVERTGVTTVLPEFVGTEYLRQRVLADAKPLPPAPGPSVAAPATKASTKAAPKYPPPPRKGGPQIMEHEIVGGPAAAEETATSGDREINEESHSEEAADGVYVEPEVVDQIVTELVYVHCKLMIVDDRYVILGSANINDRSMCGNRDSEIAMVVEDTEAVATTMDGKPYQAARFAHTLRVQLCQEHCGLLESFDQMRTVAELFAGDPPVEADRTEAERQQRRAARRIVEDPLSDDFINMWWDTAATNERIFRDVFRCVPDDTVENFDQYKKFIPGHGVPYGHALPSRTTAESLECLKKVRGHLVPMPLNFLKRENLGAKLGDKELLVPVEVFT